MTIIDTIALRVLGRLRFNSVSISKTVGSCIDILSITTSGSNFRINFAENTSLSFAYIGQVIEISGCQSQGYNLITAIGTDYIECENLHVQTDPGGKVKFYLIDFDFVKDFVYNALTQANTLTGSSFDGVKEGVEYRNGDDTTTLVLQRKKWREIISIQPAIAYFLPTGASLINVADIDEEYATERGILQVKPLITPNTPFGLLRRFPKVKIQVTGRYGYDLDEMPVPVQKALEYFACAGVLTLDMSASGNVNSFSQDGFTQSMDNGKDISSYQMMGRSLLTPFVSGVSGQ